MAESILVVTLVTLIPVLWCYGLTHQQAKKMLEAADVILVMPCDEYDPPICTSLEGIQQNTIDGLLELRNASGCPRILVIGGTEEGHGDQGTYTHENGYKVTLYESECITKYIETHGKCKRFSGNGTAFVACQDASMNVYTLDEYGWEIGYMPKEFTYLSYLSSMYPGWNVTNLK